MEFSAELHCHSTYSDGHMSPKEILMLAKKEKIDIVAITDHNEINGALEAEKTRKPGDPFIIPGIELTTSYGHLLAYFIRRKIVSKNFDDMINEIHDQGGLAIMAHPIHIPILRQIRGKDIKFPPEDKLKLADGIETYNAESGKKANEEALKLAKRLNTKTQTAGSDAHFLSEIGTAKTYFSLNELTEKEIKDAFINGKISYDKKLKSNRLCYYIVAIENLLKKKNYSQL